jgi:hypothetical protein
LVPEEPVAGPEGTGVIGRAFLLRVGFVGVDPVAEVNGFVAVADIATPVAAVIGSLIALVLAVKTDSFQIFLASFVWIFALIVLYYIGWFQVPSATLGLFG